MLLNRRIVLGILTPVVITTGVIAARFLWWHYLYSFRGPASILFLVCPQILFFPVATGIILTTMILLYDYTKSVIPAILIALGVIIAFQIQPFPRPDTPEKSHFLTYQTDYLSILEMIRDHQLDTCGDNLTANYFAYQVPSAYEHVSLRPCIYGFDDAYLVARFSPLETNIELVYIERPYAEWDCGVGYAIDQQIDENWYVCVTVPHLWD